MRPGRTQHGSLSDVLEDACFSLGRTPKEAKDALEILRQEWVDDLQALASLSEIGWRELRLPTLLKENLRQRCDELFERVAVPRRSGAPRPDGSRAAVPQSGMARRAGVSDDSDGWQVNSQPRFPRGRNSESLSGAWMTEKEYKHPALPVDANRPKASGDTAKLLQFLRQKLEQTGQDTVQGLGRRFRATDRNSDGIIDRVEFERLMQDLKVPGAEAPAQVQALWVAFDLAKTGFVSYEEFLRTVRGRMNGKREAVVKRVFQTLICGRNASLDRSNCLMYFDPCPQAQVTGASAMEVLKASPLYASRSAQGNNEKQPDLSEGELLSYYDNVSALIDNDMDFVRMVEETWSYKLKARAAIWDTEYQRAWDVAAVGDRNAKPSHSAAAICEGIRKQLFRRFQGVDGARRVAALFWQLSHGNRDLNGSTHGVGGPANGRSGQVAALRYGRSPPERYSLELLDFATVCTWLSRIQDQAMPDVDRDLLFCVLDRDGDGLISTEEFFQALRGEISVEREHLLERTFALIVGQGASAIKWGSAKLPQELLDLVGEGVGNRMEADALSRQDFIEYYLNCGLMLEQDRDLSSLLLRDWPAVAPSLMRIPLADVGGSCRGSIAGLSAGVTSSRRPSSASALGRPAGGNARGAGFGGNRLGKAMADQAAGAPSRYAAAPAF